MRLHTVGHGTLEAEAFASLVAGAGIVEVVDVRSYPGSRRHPQFGRDRLEAWLPAAGVAYSWDPRLGGRRRPVPGSPHVALDNEAFRAYADHMESDGFTAGIGDLLEQAERQSPGILAVMCAESRWWHCHRRLLADALTLLHDVEVLHLFPDGRLQPHRPTEGVRVDGTRLLYDVGVTRSLL